MSTTTTSLVVLAFVFGGALVGIFLRRVLPQQHLSDASKDIVRVGIGMVVTITALVLSLLIASAKAYYDAQSNELTEMSAKIVLLDRVLAHYGPETKEARDALHVDVALALDQMWSKNPSRLERVVSRERSSLRQNPGTRAAKRRATLAPGPGFEYYFGPRTDPVADVRTELSCSFQAIAPGAGFVAHYHLRQFRPLCAH